jgi:5-methylcytosine-specific restriction endonuclease McrA
MKCNVGLCPNDRKPGSAQCAKHSRPSSSARGYGGKRWTSTRRTVLRRDPFCQCKLTDCHNTYGSDSSACMRVSTDVDHIRDRWELVAEGIKDPDKPEYCQGLCHSCHSTKTGRSQTRGA